MPKAGQPVIVAYYGVDGACAAAALLLHHRGADVLTSSARRIGQTLTDLASRPQAPSEVHVCGLGVKCEWGDVAAAAESLRERGAEILWHCGRGYLDAQREAFERICTPVFLRLASNTQAVCASLTLGDDARALALMALAGQDRRIGPAPRPPSEDERFWLDLIEACIAQYLKYQDSAPYAAVVRKLASGQREEADQVQVAVFRRFGRRHVLLGGSEALSDLRRLIRRCAAADEGVLITGESGVGKDYVAHLIHEGSRRAMEPIVPVNCALFAGSAGLANSVLFGHKKGAFTGATADREGAFAAAHGGTLFLDEVGELPPEVQAKFLRVVEDGWVTPEGADRPERQADVRIIAASNSDLAAMIRAGAFRGDLYHRLDTLRVHVPPLREHMEDLRLIAEDAWARLVERGASRCLTERDFERLRSYDWPGNVRQLIKVLKRAGCLEMGVAEAIEEERRLGGLAPPGAGEGGAPDTLPQSLGEVRPIREVQRDYAVRVLELCGGVYTAAARLLGIATNTLKSYCKS